MRVDRWIATNRDMAPLLRGEEDRHCLDDDRLRTLSAELLIRPQPVPGLEGREQVEGLSPRSREGRGLRECEREILP